ncbi:MAG: hypothetical protein R3B91_20080 [Planctomycetaceae bacterium]
MPRSRFYTVGLERQKQQYLKRLYWWSFAIRFSVGMLGWGLVMIEAPIDVVQDAAFYEEVGWKVATEWLSGEQSETLKILMNRPHFPWLIVVGIGCFYTFTLGLRILPLLIATYCAITSFVPGMVYQMTRITGGGHRAGNLAAWLVVLGPAFVFWSSALYKEGIIIFFVAHVVLLVMRLQRRFESRLMAWLIVCLIALSALRVYLAIIMALGVGLGLLFVRMGRRSGSSVLIQQLLAVTILGMMAITAWGLGQFSEEIPTSLDEGLYQVDDIRRGLSLADSGYLHDTDVSSVSGALESMPEGLAYFLTVPWPTQRDSLRQIIAIPDTTLWTVLYAFVLLGIGQALSRNPQGVVVLLACSIGMCCFYAICIGNVGTAYRMRVQVWLLWAPFVGIALEALLPQRRAAVARLTRGPSRSMRRQSSATRLVSGPSAIALEGGDA